MSEQLCSVLVTVSVAVVLIYNFINFEFNLVHSLSRGEGHGDTVRVTGHEVGVTKVAAVVRRSPALRAVVAVPVSSLTQSNILNQR